MNLTIQIDQKASLAAGLDAPTSTAKIEVNPANLAPEIRQWIAAHLEDGHKIRGATFLVGDTPAILDQIAAIVAKEAEAEARQRAYEKKRMADRLEELRKAEPKRHYLFRRSHGGTEALADTRGGTHGPYILVDAPPAQRLDSWDHDYFRHHPEIKAEAEALILEIETSRARIIEENVARLDEEIARIEAIKAEEAAEKKALINRLPEGLRERYLAGFAEAEGRDAIRKLVFADLGLDDVEPDDEVYDGLEEYDDDLDDEEFARLTAFAKKLEVKITSIYLYQGEDGEVWARREVFAPGFCCPAWALIR